MFLLLYSRFVVNTNLPYLQAFADQEHALDEIKCRPEKSTIERES